MAQRANTFIPYRTSNDKQAVSLLLLCHRTVSILTL